MEVKQTGHCLLIIPSDYKSFQEKGGKEQDKESFSQTSMWFFSCKTTSAAPPPKKIK